ncbi:retinol dehydrogenase 12 [Fistulina hepatica ATCC 64428]|uniref:Retinol dehydrogenase 12 n=1 Tax=Fistulina hepatica ATCC 64428 TaxID=1128425 RepID=A0A0D7AE88_9AGAR|nr:retinol dehydrogenase 12 [Fistulina hepatica ATCC 64428]
MWGGYRKFDPLKDIPDLSGKVILVTGGEFLLTDGNVGLGKETILQLARHNPAHIYLAARTQSKAEQAIADIKKDVPDVRITYLPLDLTSFASIKKAADLFLAQSSRLDLLINNAGIMATPPGKTAEGYEIQFGTNHMGHALLTKLLLPTLLETAKQPGTDVRVISVSSRAHNFALYPITYDQDELNSRFAMSRYAISKLANIQYARELAAHYPHITSVSVHPGSISTDLYNSMENRGFLYGVVIPFMKSWIWASVQDGAKTQLWAATVSKDKLQNGAYYEPIGVKTLGSEFARDVTGSKRLWEWTQEELIAKGY